VVLEDTSSIPQFSSFELSSVTLQLPQSKISFFNIYRPPSSSSFSRPFSRFLDEFNSFLSVAATTPHEFVITGDFNKHLDNSSDHATSQFISVLSSFNLIQHVNFPTHNKNHTLDLVITSADSSIAPFVYTSLCSPSDHFPIFTKLSISSTPLPPPTQHTALPMIVGPSTVAHHRALALHCCKAHAKINSKMPNSTPCKIVTPKNFILKLCTRDCVFDFGFNRCSGGFSPNR